MTSPPQPPTDPTPVPPPRTTSGDPTSPSAATAPPSTSVSGADDGGGTASRAAGAAKEQGSELAGTVADEGTSVAATAKEEASHVIDEMTQQARGLVDSATDQLGQQAESQTAKLAETLERTGTQMLALAEGRTEDAGETDQFVRQLGQTVSQMATRLENLGASGILDETQRFARRRPGAFLAGAAVAGVVVSRFMRNAGAEDGNQPGARSTDSLPATGDGVPAPAALGTAPAGAPVGGRTSPPPPIPTQPGEATTDRTSPMVDLTGDAVDSERR